jgi:hypothetical protein
MSDVFFPGGAITPQVNPFGTIVPFTTAYVYQGGNLLLTIRHDGNDCGSNASLDTVASPFSQAIGVSSFTQPDNWYAQGLISMKLEYTPPSPFGINYCTANPNSTGQAGAISVMGSPSVVNDDVTLSVSNLPLNSFGYFLNSQSQGFVANPGGSQGNLCLGGAIGRYVGAGEIQTSGSTGSFDLALALPQTPTPMGFVPVQAGETWNFQSWYRDSVGGMAVSNFTDGIALTFN